MSKTVVVLPTYNEAENLRAMVDMLMSLPINLDVLIIDDNSPDGTGIIADELANQYLQSVIALHRPRKSGLGTAYITGFKHALRLGYEYIIQMDADFSHQPSYIPQMRNLGVTNDVVIASRYYRGGKVDESWGWFRKLLSWFANRIYVPLILQLPIRDATSGFRLWRRQALINLDLDRIYSNGYIFQTEMAYVAYQLGLRIAEFPIYFPDRKKGQSKMNFRIQVEAMLRVWQVRSRHHALNPTMRRTKMYS